MTRAREGPLARFTVLDLTRARAGPTAARQFGDWGANVIKIEEPGEQDGDGSPFDKSHGSDFQNLQRNRRSLLNLKSAQGLAVFKRLVAKADVLVENYRPRQAQARHRLREHAQDQSAPRVCEHQRLRRGRAFTAPAPAWTRWRRE
jgi:crotonobetainyl-CoA:carnitine CoA-transferase CaiB-like acyl-CoA transferase